MAIQTDGPAPYAPPTAVLGVINGYRDRGLATPFTLSVLQRAGVSESLAPRTLQAFKLLDLVDDQGNPTPAFIDLGKAGSAEFPERLAAILRAAYEEVFQFVEPRDDPSEKVRDAFRVYKPRGQQERMVTLFLGLCEVAGLVDARPQKARPQRKASGSNGSQRAPRATASDKAQREEKPLPRSPVTEDFHPSPPPASGQHPFIRGLIQELPPAGTEWSEAKREKWAKAALAAFHVIYELPPEEREGGGPT